MSKVISVIEMEVGEQGTIVQLQGGHGLERNLESLGIRVGNKIKKVSQQFMRGPVILAYRQTQIAVGYGMAQRILVEVE
jgi:ferrous iron transport protein A